MNFKSMNDLTIDIYKKLDRIPKNVDLVVGIPRSGMLVASLIALYLNLPLTDAESLANNHIYSFGDTKKNEKWIDKIEDARKILVVEDSVYTGNSIRKTKELFFGTPINSKLIYYAAYVTSESIQLVDIYCEIVEPPRMFEWNVLHHQHICNLCFDLDGVLCRDPYEQENDDGDKYVQFISNVEPLVIPTFTIGYIITSRLEKYRNETENWLHKNGIKFNKLVMMQFNTKEERIKSGSYGAFKGIEFKKIHSSTLFIESDPRQAKEIADISGKAVFCTGDHRFYDESVLTQSKNTIKRKINRHISPKIKQKLKNLLLKLFQFKGYVMKG